MEEEKALVDNKSTFFLIKLCVNGGGSNRESVLEDVISFGRNKSRDILLRMTDFVFDYVVVVVVVWGPGFNMIRVLF